MPSTSVIGIVKIVSHISEYFCGTYLLGVTCKEITALLDILLVRDTATEKNKPQTILLYLKACLGYLFPASVMYIIWALLRSKLLLSAACPKTVSGPVFSVTADKSKRLGGNVSKTMENISHLLNFIQWHRLFGIDSCIFPLLFSISACSFQNKIFSQRKRLLKC